jgi:hypothetical protein
MVSKRIRRGRMQRERSLPCDFLGLWNQTKGGGRQRRHMKRLANVASRVGTAAGVAMERRTSNKVQQRQAAQQGQRSPQIPLPENNPLRVHTPMPSNVTTLDGQRRVLVAGIS